MGQGHQAQPRWSDMVDDCISGDDLVGVAEDRVVVGVEDSAAAPTKSRRKRCRGKRAKLAGGNGINQQYAMNNAINADAFGHTDLRDRAAQTLADLGLLISTPESDTPLNQPALPEKVLMGQGGIMVTAPLHSRLPGPAYSHAVAVPPSPQHSFVGGIAYPCYVVQPAVVPQPMPTMCAVVPMQSQFYC